MFSVHTTPEEFKDATITACFGFVFEEKLGRGTQMMHFVFEKFRFQNVFRPHQTKSWCFLLFEERLRKAPFS